MISLINLHINELAVTFGSPTCMPVIAFCFLFIGNLCIIFTMIVIYILSNEVIPCIPSSKTAKIMLRDPTTIVERSRRRNAKKTVKS